MIIILKLVNFSIKNTTTAMMIPVGNMTKASVILSIEIGLNNSCPSHETAFFLLVCKEIRLLTELFNEMVIKITKSLPTDNFKS